MNPRTCVKLSCLTKRRSRRGNKRRTHPLKLRACLNDTDVPYFDRFFLVDKMANKYVPRVSLFSRVCLVYIEYKYYVHRCGLPLFAREYEDKGYTLDYMPPNEKIQRIHLLCANDS